MVNEELNIEITEAEGLDVEITNNNINVENVDNNVNVDIVEAEGLNVELTSVDMLDSIPWGDISGDISDQTDLQSALDLKADKSNVLELDNTTPFIPDSDYEPATKKYVDENSLVETDPVFTSHPAYGITSEDINNIDNLSGTNTGDQDLSGKQDVLGFTPEDVANKDTTITLGNSNTKYPSQLAVKTYVDNILGSANAVVYKGTIDCTSNPNYPTANAGFLYIVSGEGKIGGILGVEVEVGDMLICNTDSTESGDQSSVGVYWNIIQKNIVGAVTGPSNSVNNNVALFDGVTGKVIKDSGLTLSGTNTGDQDLSGYYTLNQTTPQTVTVGTAPLHVIKNGTTKFFDTSIDSFGVITFETNDGYNFKADGISILEAIKSNNGILLGNGTGTEIIGFKNTVGGSQGTIGWNPTSDNSSIYNFNVGGITISTGSPYAWDTNKAFSVYQDDRTNQWLEFDGSEELDWYSWKFNGTENMNLDSSGNLDVVGNITLNGASLATEYSVFEIKSDKNVTMSLLAGDGQVGTPDGANLIGYSGSGLSSNDSDGGDAGLMAFAGGIGGFSESGQAGNGGNLTFQGGLPGGTNTGTIGLGGSVTIDAGFDIATGNYAGNINIGTTAGATINIGNGNPVNIIGNTDVNGALTCSSIVEDTPTLMKLDQTTPQSVINGKPIFTDGIQAKDVIVTGDIYASDTTGFFIQGEDKVDINISAGDGIESSRAGAFIIANSGSGYSSTDETNGGQAGTMGFTGGTGGASELGVGGKGGNLQFNGGNGGSSRNGTAGKGGDISFNAGNGGDGFTLEDEGLVSIGVSVGREVQIGKGQPININGNTTITGNVSATNLSGTNTGDQDLSGLLPTSHLTDFTHSDIAHSNRASLDLVSGTNTGDQDLSGYALKSNVLELNNTTPFTPDADYEPATKKYVDENGGSDFTSFFNNDIDTGTEPVCSINVDENSSFSFNYMLTNNIGSYSGKTLGTLLKAPDGYGGYTYSVGYNSEHHTVGTVSGAITFTLTYDSTSKILFLNAVVDSNGWVCKGKFMRIDA